MEALGVARVTSTGGTEGQATQATRRRAHGT